MVRISFITYLLISMIKIYQNTLSLLFYPSCRFDLSCSNYGIIALHHFGTIKGSWLIVKRILSCHSLCHKNKMILKK